MAEYCKTCADKYGFKDDNPYLCEGCGEIFAKKKLLQKIKLILSKIKQP